MPATHVYASKQLHLPVPLSMLPPLLSWQISPIFLNCALFKSPLQPYLPPQMLARFTLFICLLVASLPVGGAALRLTPKPAPPARVEQVSFQDLRSEDQRVNSHLVLSGAVARELSSRHNSSFATASLQDDMSSQRVPWAISFVGEIIKGLYALEGNAQRGPPSNLYQQLFEVVSDAAVLTFKNEALGDVAGRASKIWSRFRPGKQFPTKEFQHLLGDFIGHPSLVKSWALGLSRGLPPGMRGNINVLKYMDDLSDNVKLGNAVPVPNISVTNYRGRFYAKFKDAPSDMQVHHAVPQAVFDTKYPGLISEAQLHSLENLRGIPNGALYRGLPAHAAITQRWSKFYKQHPTASLSEILDHVKDLDDELGEFLIPPIR